MNLKTEQGLKEKMGMQTNNPAQASKHKGVKQERNKRGIERVTGEGHEMIMGL